MQYKGSDISVSTILYQCPFRRDDVDTFTSLRVPFNERPNLYLLWGIVFLCFQGSSLFIVLNGMEYKTNIVTININRISNII